MTDPRITQLLSLAQDSLGQARFLADLHRSLPWHDRESLRLAQAAVCAVRREIETAPRFTLEQ